MSFHDASKGFELNISDISQGLWQNLPPELLEKIGFFLDLGSAAMLVFIIYFAIVILTKIFILIFGTRESRMLKKICEQLNDIISILKKTKKKKIG